MKYYLLRVHGDVFRPPRKPMLLSVLVGNGVQIAIMSLITLSTILFVEFKFTSNYCFYRIVFACLGFLSPARRGAFMTCKNFLEIFLFFFFIF